MAKKLTPRQKARAAERAAATKQIRKEIAAAKHWGYDIRADVSTIKPTARWRRIAEDYRHVREREKAGEITFFRHPFQYVAKLFGVKKRADLQKLQPRFAVRGRRVMGTKAKGENLHLTKKGELIVERKVNGRLVKTKALPTNADYKKYQALGAKFVVNLGTPANPRPHGFDDVDTMFRDMDKYNRTTSADWRTLVEVIEP